MRKKKKKTFNLNGYIFGALARIWGWWPPRKEILEMSVRWVDGKEYNICNKCDKLFLVLKTKTRGGKLRRKLQVQVDHIIPKIDPVRGPEGWDVLIDRTFLPITGLQVLCTKVCHAAKTKKENALRRKK